MANTIEGYLGESKALDSVGRILDGAGVDFVPDLEPADDPAIDGVFRLTASGNRLYVQYVPGLAPYQVESVVQRLRDVVAPIDRIGLCVRRMSWTLLDACKRFDIALFDLEGNAYVRLPGVYIERIRAGRADTREPTSGTVFTAKASRIVRALLRRYPHDWTQSDMAKQTGLSAGYVSILTKRLIGQGYVSNRTDLLYLDEPDRLLDDWAAHYRFDRHRRLNYALNAGSYDEGIAKLGAALSESTARFAWTGWTGAHLRAPHATPTMYMAYVSDVPRGMKNVFSVEKDGNVALYVPQDGGVFQFGTAASEGEIVSDEQLYIDLFRMPGRAKEQADALRHHRLDFSARTS